MLKNQYLFSNHVSKMFPLHTSKSENTLQTSMTRNEFSLTILRNR